MAYTGWRAKIGVLAPTTGAAVENDFHRYAPDGVDVITTRIPFDGPTPKGLHDQANRLENASEVFRGREIDLIVFACTSGSLIGGPDFDKECALRIQKGAGDIPVVTTAGLLLDAFRIAGVSKLTVFTPYPADATEAVRIFLEANGVAVSHIESIPGAFEQTAHHIFRYLRKRSGLFDGDAVFLSCTGLNVLEIIEPAETDFGLPFFTSNQITLWGSLRKAGVKEKVNGIGSLLLRY
jgi:maleate isomerase